jgi:inosine-uridine nucleoside N-ribohydrolase
MCTQPKPAVWIDTDVGADDVVAIAMLLKNTVTSRWLLGMTSVFGNAHSYNASVNLHRILQFVNRSDVSVTPGVDIHFVGGHSFPDSWFPMSDRLDGIPLPDVLPYSPATVSAARAIMNGAAAYPGMQILAIGPLTNIAVAVLLGGDTFVENVGSIVIMAGAVAVAGNVPPSNSSEWNAYGDPLALDTVLRALGPKTTLVPLDAIYPVTCTQVFRQKVCVPPVAQDTPTTLMCESINVVCGWGDDGLSGTSVFAVFLPGSES